MALGGGNGPALDAGLRVYYDGAGTPAVDIDMGTLKATHFGAGSVAGAHTLAHVHVEINSTNVNTGFLLTFPMTFGTRAGGLSRNDLERRAVQYVVSSWTAATRRASAVLLIGAAVVWVLVDKAVAEGPTLVVLSAHHGITASDLLSVAAIVLAVTVWPWGRARRSRGRSGSRTDRA